jgi:hypothetical protein
VNNGFMLDVKSYSFYHRSSTTGYTNYQLLVNGILVGSGSIFVSSGSTLQSTGTINVANAIAGLTGSVSVTLKLFGGSNGNNATFRLDDFTLNGYTQEVQVYAEGYRYGFQNQEKDDEIKGAGNSMNYTYRMHDPRVGRFFAVDPLIKKFPYYSSYAFSGNRVIDAIELEGKEPEDFLINFIINSVKSYIIQTSQKYIENTVKNVANGTLNYVESRVEISTSNLLISTAKERNPNVENLSESEKQKDFRTNAEKTQGILLYEFATGTGKTEREFNYPDPIVKEIASGYVLGDILNKFNEHLKKEKLTLSEWSKKGENFESDIPFSPDHAGTLKSISRHFSSNSSQFLIGGSTFVISPSSKEGLVSVTIENKMSKNSLFLHVLDNKDNGQLRTTTQKFNFGLDFGDNKKKK